MLYAHPAVAEAAVVGMPDPVMGEEGCAFVVLRAGATATPDALIAFCQERLAKFKCPRQVRFVDALPKSPSHREQHCGGKLLPGGGGVIINRAD